MNNTGTMTGPGHHDSSIGFSSGANIVLAIWLFLSSWIVGYTSVGMLWSNLIVGAAVFVLAIVRVNSQSHAGVPSWINAALGIWAIISPFVFHATTGEKWNCVIVGVLITLFALTSGTAGATRTQ